MIFDHLNWPLLFACFIIGLVLAAVMDPPLEYVEMYPLPGSKHTYTDKLGVSCYRYIAEEVPCTEDAMHFPHNRKPENETLAP